MLFESPYLNKSFSGKMIPRYLATAFLVGPLTIIMVYAFSMNGSDKGRGEAFSKMMDGIKQLGPEEYGKALLFGIPLSLVFAVVLYFMHNYKKLIVSIEFDNTNSELKLISRSINHSRLEETTIPYNKLRLVKKKNVYDAMANHGYSGIEIRYGSAHIGFVLENHFTWSTNQYKEIQTHLINLPQ
jgi:hypothetical protein